MIKAITTNGLKLRKYSKYHKKIKECGKSLLNIAYGDTGHLGDIVSGIRTNISILEMQAEKIWKEFELQKNTTPEGNKTKEGE